jgi:hypothetical protein
MLLIFPWFCSNYYPFISSSQADLERADELQGVGTQLMSSRHYGVDSIRPKCVELCRMAQTLGERLQYRLALLAKCHLLQERVEKVS